MTAPGIAPVWHAVFRASSRSLHATLVSLYDGGLGHDQPAVATVNHRPHSQREREIFGAVARIDSGYHGTAQIARLLGDKRGRQTRFEFAALRRPEGAE